jgi:hypothetical protein
MKSIKGSNQQFSVYYREKFILLYALFSYWWLSACSADKTKGWKMLLIHFNTCDVIPLNFFDITTFTLRFYFFLIKQVNDGYISKILWNHSNLHTIILPEQVEECRLSWLFLEICVFIFG